MNIPCSLINNIVKLIYSRKIILHHNNLELSQKAFLKDLYIMSPILYALYTNDLENIISPGVKICR